MIFNAVANGWLTVTVPDELSKEAQHMREERDKRYGNIYQERSTDERWVGDLGEICFDQFLNEQIPSKYEWITDDAHGRPDFIIRGNPLGCKTVKRKVPMRPSYTAQITARHAHEPVGHFFFLCYELPQKRMWLLGGIEKERFLKLAVYYPAGAEVHKDYIVRPGHEIYNIEVKHLTPPLKWLKQF